MSHRNHTVNRGSCRAALAAVMLFCAVNGHADPDGEREALARLIHELQLIEPLIASAESQAIPERRIRFRYDWLRQDLRRIRDGLQDHIDAPRNEPRTFPPLRGDYRQ